MKECKIEGTVMSVKTVIQDANDYSGTTCLTIETKDGISYKIWGHDLVKEILGNNDVVFFSVDGTVPKIGGYYDFVIAKTNHKVIAHSTKAYNQKYWDEEYQYCNAGAFFASGLNMYQSIAISGIFITILLVFYIYFCKSFFKKSKHNK